MYNYNRLNTLMERIVHKYNQFEKKRRRYTGGAEVTQAEIHTIDCIGDHPGLNLTQLANDKGITKSAASQMVRRLRDKGLVIKHVSPTSDAEINLDLTAVGWEAYEAHKTYHATTAGHFFRILSQLPEDTAKEIEHILQEFDLALDEMIHE